MHIFLVIPYYSLSSIDFMHRVLIIPYYILFSMHMFSRPDIRAAVQRASESFQTQ